MPVLQEQTEDAVSKYDGTIVPEEQSSSLHGSHQQLAGIWTPNRNGFSSAWAPANSTDSADESKLAQSTTTPQKTWLPGLEHRSPTAGTPTSTKVLLAPSGSFLHHRRNSSRMSTYPDVPSPLAAELYVRSPRSNGSSLMSPLPSPGHSQQPEKIVHKTPQKLDLHILKVSANAKGSPYHKPQGFGHSRKITDPFVDNAKSEDQSLLPSPFVTRATRTMEHISSFQGGSADSAAWNSPVSATTPSGNGNAAAFVPHAFQFEMQEDGFCTSRMPAFSPLPTMSPMAPDFKPLMAGASRVDLPIPPPALSSVDSQLAMTPVTRAHLDAQAAARAEWIREGAKTIAALSRLSFVAGQQFQKTGTQEDYEKWQRLVTAYEDATDLEKRQEERRKMFMPKGMQAMKIGPYNIADDQSASFAEDNEDDEGHLLGFKMTYMERICAEVKRRDDAKKETELEKEAEITMEMINTLSLNEKKELKKCLLARLQNFVDKKD